MNIKEILIHALGGVTNDELRTAKAKAVAETEAKLKGDIGKTIKTNGDLIKENLNLSKKCGELEAKLAALGEVKEEPKKEETKKPTYSDFDYMLKSFEGMYLTEIVDDSPYKYLSGEKIAENCTQYMSRIYGLIWERKGCKTITFKEFNEEYTILMHNQSNRAVLPEFYVSSLNNTKQYFKAIAKGTQDKYKYDMFGKLVVK